MSRPVIAIVGAGFSGALTALNILRPREVSATAHLIEEAERFGVGAAFNTEEAGHLLNVRAQNMSADPDAPDEFVQWLARRRGAAPDPFAFASRTDYGAYIQDRLRHVVQAGDAAGRLNLVQDSVVAIEALADGFRVRLGVGRELRADAVVVAIGNAPPSAAALPDPDIADHPAYIGAPWRPGAFADVQPDDSVLLLGTGLTMIDVVASLEARGHVGPLTALSRHGLLPQAHARTIATTTAVWARGNGEPLSDALRRFRQAAQELPDWRIAFDGLRPITQHLWKTLDSEERRRFLRHLRPWWEIHRHRLAPRMAEALDAWRSDRLEVIAGRLTRTVPLDDGVEVAWRPRGTYAQAKRHVRWIVNCTGPEGDPRRLASPLVQQLLRARLVRPDPYGLGLDVTEEGQLVDADGRPHSRLFGIGPIARGALWEIAAVPDIRVEARRLGYRLARLDQAAVVAAG
ncbi:MAG TPA: FAD/NAD(P)-binding protein [Caulobacteraceae bacterium]